MIIFLKNKHTLQVDDFYFKCCIGQNGLTTKKVEGDNKTPIGLYALGPLYYRKEKFTRLSTKLKKIQIKKNMGWCDDVNSKLYNKPIKTNTQFRHEKLYRNDRKYDLLIPIKYNFIKPNNSI
jgi:L,D-peptidoglycan transpeptidase YkuD (ErfK/YbiS/YcfS/YnhG family)